MKQGRWKIAVLGPVTRDTIVSVSGTTSDRYGCALYTSVALASLSGVETAVHLVSHVRKADAGPLRDMLAAYPNIDTTSLSSEADRGDLVHLTYQDQNHRDERQTGYMCPILPKHLEELMDCDAFVFVPITDFEVPLETLRFIRENSDALIVFDAHGPTTGCARNGTRYPKLWIDRDRWLPYIDILKMNLEEARSSWFEGAYGVEELDEHGRLTMDELPLLAQHCLDHGVSALYVTLDQHGCAAYFKNAKGRMREHLVKRVRIDKVVDTTGCGDSFAAGVTLGYLATDDYVTAAQFGNYAGAQRCSSTDLHVYGTFADAKAVIADAYGD